MTKPIPIQLTDEQNDAMIHLAQQVNEDFAVDEPGMVLAQVFPEDPDDPVSSPKRRTMQVFYLPYEDARVLQRVVHLMLQHGEG